MGGPVAGPFRAPILLAMLGIHNVGITRSEGMG